MWGTLLVSYIRPPRAAVGNSSTRMNKLNVSQLNQTCTLWVQRLRNPTAHTATHTKTSVNEHLYYLTQPLNRFIQAKPGKTVVWAATTDKQENCKCTAVFCCQLSPPPNTSRKASNCQPRAIC